MEWYLCDNWDCIATWAWSTEAAAYLQAFVTLLGLITSYLLGNRAFVREIRRESAQEHLNQNKNLARIKVAVLNIVAAVETTIRIRAGNDGSIFTPQFESAMSEVLENKDLLRALMLSDLPHPKIVAYVNSAASTSADFVSFCLFAVDKGDDNEGLVASMLGFIDDMTKRHDV
ncbi:MAG: hypothetical protein VX935_07800 [Pseudomonadota bacterium]|jgi:hypothetical protein|nr:hypothetical protein [Pseudomonadota bacterium]HAM76004.1 hypothetical protein [Alcanivorax sp.]HBM22410.1 hypothetical protein [Alcanivorax sp.]|tara:strand:- start:3122 stop:3640 length:519 start_codon:yes stop_codon:yes gene_type:complete